MKIITFQGGLGNQLFQYIYYQYLLQNFPKETFYGFYSERLLKNHNGLEICKWFDVELPQASPVSNIIATTLLLLGNFCIKLKLSPPFTDNDWYHHLDSIFYQGYWQDKKYMQKVGKPTFRTDLIIDYKNKIHLKNIQSSNSIAVHVRRGDYTTPKACKIYGGIGTLDFYKKAITIIKEKIDNPSFFFFSDDTNYVKSNFQESNMQIIACNKGERSFFDLYLMSKCKNMIIPNSTFSCWAAYLNNNNPIVICPKIWRNDKPSPDVILDTWIKI